MYTVKIGNGQKLRIFKNYKDAFEFAKVKHQETGKSTYIYDDGRYGTEHRWILSFLSEKGDI